MNRVINFHRVTDHQWFDTLICFLKSKYNLVDVQALKEFYDGNLNLKNACHLTIDDGDESFYNIIFPVLKKHKVPASLYVSPKICREKRNFWFQEIEEYDPLFA